MGDPMQGMSPVSTNGRGSLPLSQGSPMVISPVMKVAHGSPHRVSLHDGRGAGTASPASPVVAYVSYQPPPITAEGSYIPTAGASRSTCNCARTKCDTRRCKCYREKRACVGCNCVDCANLPGKIYPK